MEEMMMVSDIMNTKSITPGFFFVFEYNADKKNNVMDSKRFIA